MDDLLEDARPLLDIADVPLAELLADDSTLAAAMRRLVELDETYTIAAFGSAL